MDEPIIPPETVRRHADGSVTGRTRNGFEVLLRQSDEVEERIRSRLFDPVANARAAIAYVRSYRRP